MNVRAVAALAIPALLLCARLAGAVPIDGHLEVDYGAALVTQTTQTGLSNGQIIGDNNANDLNFANGSELDQAYAFISSGVLYLFLSGNLAMEPNANQNGTVGHILDLFVDSAPGGQNSLNGLGSGNPLNGLTFDAGFTADYWLELSGSAVDGPGKTPIWYAGYAALQTPGGGTLMNLGAGPAGGPGTLSGGSNPYGILVTIDNHNVAGVTYGCGSSSGAGVTTGVEWAIPLTAIGSPTGCFNVTVVIRGMGTTNSPVSNQVFGPVPAGTCPLGSASTVNFAGIAGDQWFSICPSTTDVADGAPRLALHAPPNPHRGGPMLVGYDLADAGPARLQMLDCTGRVVRERALAGAGGYGVADLSAGPRLASGVYWLRLCQGVRSVSRKLCVVR